MNKIDENMNFFYGDFHALKKASAWTLRRSRWWLSSARPAVESPPSCAC